MENVKYIPGDLVMTDGVPTGTKKCVVYVVTASDPSKTLTLKDGTINKGVVTLDAITEEDKADFVETTTWVKHIVPIPLTPAILEANGWKMGSFERDEDDFLFQPCYKRGSILNFDYYSELSIKPVVKETRSFLSAISDIKEIRLRKIKFVHQLQHLLFGLGLNSELKV